MSKRILTTTGFLLPDNNLFEVYEEKRAEFDEFVGRNNNFELTMLCAYYRENKVSFSKQADTMHRKYQADKSFENYVALVDFTAEVLSLVDCRSFMEWQAYNRHASMFSMAFCRDLITGNIDKFEQYDNLTSQSRFVTNNWITKETGKQRYTSLMAGVNPSMVSWVNVLSPLLSKRGSFITTFRYLFVDNF